MRITEKFAARAMSNGVYAWAAVTLFSVAGCSNSAVLAGANSADGVALGAVSAPFAVDFGTVEAKSKHEKVICLRNVTGKSVEVNAYTASCECTTVAGLPLTVPAHSEKNITVTADLSDETDFYGGLGITIELKSGDTAVGTIEVRCDVAKPETGTDSSTQ